MLQADCVPEIENKTAKSLMLMCPCKDTIKLSLETNYSTDKVSLFVDPSDLAEP